MKCKRHPTYLAKREPRSECQSCWLMWLKKRVADLETSFQMSVRWDDGWL
jgi:hypothetical protein